MICKCGCGQEVKGTNSYIHGHNSRTRPYPVSKLCECGCGELTNPGRKRLKYHTRRIDINNYEIVDLGFETPCWIWNGPEKDNGYGLMGRGGKRLLAHRESYKIHRGPIPKGYDLHHKCGHKKCINPDHLEILTRKYHSRIGGRVKLTQEQVDEIRQSDKTTVELGEVYGVSSSHISRIRNYKKWK